MLNRAPLRLCDRPLCGGGEMLRDARGGAVGRAQSCGGVLPCGVYDGGDTLCRGFVVMRTGGDASGDVGGDASGDGVVPTLGGGEMLCRGLPVGVGPPDVVGDVRLRAGCGWAIGTPIVNRDGDCGDMTNDERGERARAWRAFGESATLCRGLAFDSTRGRVCNWSAESSTARMGRSVSSALSLKK